MLVWLEVDAMLRRMTGNQRGMDDFARAFFGGRDCDWGVVTYTVEDVARTLNGIAPYDWLTYLNQRQFEAAEGAPMKGFTDSGYRLVFTPEPTSVWKDTERRGKGLDLSFSGGFSLDKDNRVNGVIWDGPAFKAGLTVGTQVVGVNDKPVSFDALKAAITTAASDRKPVRLLVRKFDRLDTLNLDWTGGLRYPRFEKTGAGEGALDRLLAPR